MERCRCSAPCLLLPAGHAEKLLSLCDAESLLILHSVKSGLVRSLLAQVHRRRSGAFGLELGLWDAWA